MTRMFVTPINIILAVLLLAAMVTGFVMLPGGAVLPIHWGLDGQPDGWAVRDVALLIPVGLVIGLGVIFAMIRRYGAKGRSEAGFYVIRAVFSAFLLMGLGLEAGTVAIGLGYPVNMVQIVVLCLAVLIIVLGNAMPKSQPNGFAGLRIPSTLRDPANWQATHRLAGGLMIAGGIVIALAALVIPSSGWLIAVVIGAVMIPLIIGTFYSLRYSKR
jgi:uncharacterized membrane protein